MDYLEDILKGHRLKIKSIGGVVVSGHCLGVAVDHDGFVASIAKGKGGVNTGVVKLNTLANAVWPRSQNHYLLAI